MRPVRRIALTLATLLVVVAFPAAVAGARSPGQYFFNVSSGNVDELVRFQGDPASCAAHGVCGYSGTVHYVFRVTTGGALASYPDRGIPSGFVFGFLQGRGTATADVAVDGQMGSVPHCTDAVTLRADAFNALLRGHRTTVALHDAGAFTIGSVTTPPSANTLDTHCAGPSDADLDASGATPSRRYATSRFRRVRFDLRFAGTRPFHAGGFAGTVRFRVRFRLRREAAVPSGQEVTTIG
jgi:hypothetical protein